MRSPSNSIGQREITLSMAFSCYVESTWKELAKLHWRNLKGVTVAAMSSSLNALAHFNMAMGLWRLMSTGSDQDLDKGWSETRCCVKDHMKVFFPMIHLKLGIDVDLMWGKMLKQNTDMLMVSTRGRLRNQLLIPQMGNMEWNGNYWSLIRKSYETILKTLDSSLFTETAGQGMMELFTFTLPLLVWNIG